MSKKREPNSAQQQQAAEQAVPYNFTPDPLKQQLLIDLARKAFGHDGSADALVMLLQLIRDSMPDYPAEEYAETVSLLFDAQRCVFNNSHGHVCAFMDYRQRMSARVANYLGEPFLRDQR